MQRNPDRQACTTATEVLLHMKGRRLRQEAALFSTAEAVLQAGMYFLLLREAVHPEVQLTQRQAGLHPAAEVLHSQRQAHRAEAHHPAPSEAVAAAEALQAVPSVEAAAEEAAVAADNRMKLIIETY